MENKYIYVIITPWNKQEWMPLLLKGLQIRTSCFVHFMKWPLFVSNGCELDQFDHEGAYYIFCLKHCPDEISASKGLKKPNRFGDFKIVGYQRVIPGSQKFMVEEVFKECLAGTNHTRSLETMELTRLYFSGRQNHENLKRTQSCVHALAGITGVLKMISYSTDDIFEILQEIKFDFRQMGGWIKNPDPKTHGDWDQARYCQIAADPEWYKNHFEEAPAILNLEDFSHELLPQDFPNKSPYLSPETIQAHEAIPQEFKDNLLKTRDELTGKIQGPEEKYLKRVFEAYDPED